MPVRPALDSQKLKRLALMRLMHGQAMELARQPEPLSASAVLTFHDVAEHFLILAAEHMAAGPVSREKDLTQYWSLLRSRRGFRGVELSHQHGITRLISVRNDFKHAGRLPTADDIADARSAVTGLLEENVPKIFDLELAAIDMTYVVPQQAAQDRLRAAAAAEASGDRVEAMAQLAEAFEELFRLYGGAHGTYGFGNTVQKQTGFPIGFEVAMMNLASGNFRNGLIDTGRKADGRLTELTNAVAAIQAGMRVLALGIDYSRYDRFERLTPQVWGQGEHRHVRRDADYSPTGEEYEYCVQFVVTVSLRIAEVETSATPVSWRAGWPS